MQWTLQAAGRLDVDLAVEQVEVRNEKQGGRVEEVVPVTRIVARHPVDEQVRREAAMIDRLRALAVEEGWTFGRLCTAHHGIVDLV